MVEAEFPRLLVGLRIVINRNASRVPLAVAFDIYFPLVFDRRRPLLHFFGAAPGLIEGVVVYI